MYYHYHAFQNSLRFLSFLRREFLVGDTLQLVLCQKKCTSRIFKTSLFTRYAKGLARKTCTNNIMRRNILLFNLGNISLWHNTEIFIISSLCILTESRLEYFIKNSSSSLFPLLANSSFLVLQMFRI